MADWITAIASQIEKLAAPLQPRNSWKAAVLCLSGWILALVSDEARSIPLLLPLAQLGSVFFSLAFVIGLGEIGYRRRSERKKAEEKLSQQRSLIFKSSPGQKTMLKEKADNHIPSLNASHAQNKHHCRILRDRGILLEVSRTAAGVDRNTDSYKIAGWAYSLLINDGEVRRWLDEDEGEDPH